MRDRRTLVAALVAVAACVFVAGVPTAAMSQTNGPPATTFSGQGIDDADANVAATSPTTATNTSAAALTLAQSQVDAQDSRAVVVFQPEDTTEASTSASVTFQNQQPYAQQVSSVTVGRTPPEFSALIDSAPTRLPANGGGVVTVEVTADASVPAGTTTETEVTLRTVNGSVATATLEIEVRKPPALGTQTDSVDLGTVFPGDSVTGPFTLTERTGYDSITRPTVEEILRGSPSGSIAFPGLDDTTVPADGTAEQTVEISAAEDATRGQQLSWEVSLVTQLGLTPPATISFSAQVIYPPYYESIDLRDTTVVFDEPRDQTETITRERDVAITNGGDATMDVNDVSATIDHDGIDAAVRDVPSTIPGGSSRTVVVEIAADTEVPEGQWELELEVDADEPAPLAGEPTGTVTRTATVTVEHPTELTVSETEIDAGKVVFPDSVTDRIEIGERLGYNDIESLSIEQVSGPEEGWLTLAGTNVDRLAAGSTRALNMTLQFDPGVEFFKTYTWEFEVSGDDVETRTITILATPEIQQFDDVIADLEAANDATTGEASGVTLEMVNALESLEARLRDSEASFDQADIPAVVTTARSAILYAEALQETDAAIEEGDREGAQTSLVRAAAAFATLSDAAEDIEDPEIGARISTASTTAGTVLENYIERQQEYFSERLEGSETSRLQEAQINRELALLAELRGDQQEATNLRETAQDAFEEYSTLVADANENLIEARERRDELDESLFMSPLGQRVFFIGSYTTYDTETGAVLEQYDEAESQFAAAGATERAETAATERERLSSSYDDALLVSAALGVVFVLVFVLLLAWEIRALYRYRLDAEAAVTGDFLLPWAENQ